MKHQTFKKNTYVEIDTGKPHLTVVGKVKDSTITLNRIRYEQTFNMPQQSIQIEPKLMIIHEDPETKNRFVNDICFIADIISEFDGITINKLRLYVSIEDLSIPGQELKDEFYKLNQGAK